MSCIESVGAEKKQTKKGWEGGGGKELQLYLSILMYGVHNTPSWRRAEILHSNCVSITFFFFLSW